MQKRNKEELMEVWSYPIGGLSRNYQIILIMDFLKLGQFWRGLEGLTSLRRKVGKVPPNSFKGRN